MLDARSLALLGWTPEDLRRLRERAGGPFESVDDVQRVLDRFGYLEDWRRDYRVQSVRASLAGDRITCIDAAVLSYGLLDFFPEVRRAILAIHRRSPAGEECGHCVTLYRIPGGQVGAFSKSSFPGLGHRDPVHADEAAIALSFARAYVDMGFEPLYFGVTTLEEAAGDLDWRFSSQDLSALCERIKQRYEYAFS
jgi:hypothetical protein